MKKLKEKLEKHQKIACLLNVYEDNIGNCTKVVFSDGSSMLLNQSAGSTLRNIAKYYTVDISELRKKQRKLLDATYNTPLPISSSLLFIYVRTRQPRVKKDSCVSYINFHEIERLDKKLPLIHMKNGEKIESLESLKTITKRYNKGEISARLLQNEHHHIPIVAEDSVTYLYPATKGDVRAIAREVEELRELMKRILISEKD